MCSGAIRACRWTRTSRRKPKPIDSSATTSCWTRPARYRRRRCSPDDRRARDLPIDADPADTLVDSRALDDDEVVVDDPTSPLFEPRDLLHDETDPPAPIRAACRTRRLRFRRSHSSHEEVAVPERSPFRAVALLIAGIAVGLIGGYAIWGRGTAAPVATTAHDRGDAGRPRRTTPAPGREFSEQAVTPRPPQAADARQRRRQPRPSRGSRTADRGPRRRHAAEGGGRLLGDAGRPLDAGGRRSHAEWTLARTHAVDARTRCRSGDTTSASCSPGSRRSPKPSSCRRHAGAIADPALLPQSAAGQARPAAPRETPATPPRAAARPAPSRAEPQSGPRSSPARSTSIRGRAAPA